MEGEPIVLFYDVIILLSVTWSFISWFYYRYRQTCPCRNVYSV